MTDFSRHNPTPADEQQSASLKDLVRAIARASARQHLSDMERQSGGGIDGSSAATNSESSE
ncbi:hypothetical protein [Shimia abyssi]|uniref:hypothetical protein n=1 Tax=Shimia abyssi TaxID=1662395 RepID=UPI000D0D4B69|nr:hypothetical protein [Shimia abyssi]